MSCNCYITSWAYSNKKIDYKFKYNKKKAGGILKHKNRLLLVQSRGNMWGFPKGSLELNESMLDCALREVQEETSLLIPFTENDKKYYINDTVFFYKNLEDAPSINHQKIKKIKNNDCSGIAWINLECLEKIKYLLDPRGRSEFSGRCIEIEDVNDFLGHKVNCDEKLSYNIHNIKINSSLRKFIKTNLKYLKNI
jgi:8-oxo-dGTP pyrophosphatase MutT (NUDIX family)